MSLNSSDFNFIFTILTQELMFQDKQAQNDFSVE